MATLVLIAVIALAMLWADVPWRERWGAFWTWRKLWMIPVALALFGPAGYGHRSGLLSVPARGTQAAAPFLFGLLLESGGPLPGLALTTGLTLAALAALTVITAGLIWSLSRSGR